MARIDKTKKDAYMLKTLIDMFERGDIRTDHPLQRNPGRWTTDYRDGEIATIIKEENMDTIKICEQITVDEHTGRKIIENWLIDGLQRLTYAMKYQMGAFKMGKNIEFPIVSFTRAIKDENGNFVLDEEGRRTYEDVDFDLRGKGYKDLPSELQDSFDSYCIDVVKHLDCTNEEIGYHIRRYNKQANMNGSEKTITYLDTIAESIKKLSSHRFFKDNCTKISSNEKIKGAINKIVIESLMILNFFEDWTKDSKKQGLYLEEKATEEHFNQLSQILDRLSDVVTEENEKLFTSKNTFVFVKMFKYFIDNYNLPDEEFSKYLDALLSGLNEKEIELLNEVKIYGEEVIKCSFKVLNEGKSTKDKGIVANKLHILETLMDEYFGKDNELTDPNDKNTEENNNVVVISGKDVHIEEDENRNDNKKNKDKDSEMETIDFVRKYVNKDVTEEDIDDYFDYINSCVNVSKIVKSNAAVIGTDNENAIIGVVCYAYKNDIDMDLWLQRYSIAHVTFDNNMSQKDRLFSMIKSLKNFESMRQKTSAM